MRVRDRREKQEMAHIQLTPKDIYEQEFKIGVRGYNKNEVDAFLDDVIHDYELYVAMIKELKEENRQLKEEIRNKKKKEVNRSALSNQEQADFQPNNSMTNFDILRRISRLEKEVFGKQISNK